MFFDFGPKSATLLIFFVHGIVFSSLLLFRAIKDGHKSNFWLASFIFLCALYIAPFMFGYANWYSVEFYRNILFYIPFQQLFLMPPILYFYVKYLLNESHSFQKKDGLHFAPAFIYIVYAFIVWVTDQLVLKEYYFYADGRDMDLDLWYQVAGFIFMVVYLVKSLRLYQQYRKRTSDIVSFADSITFPWIHKFLTAFLMLLLIRILFFILNPEWANFGSKYWYYLTFSILFYYISVSGYMHSTRLEFTGIRSYNFNHSLEKLIKNNDDEGHVNSTKKESEEVTIPEYDVELKSKLEDLMNVEKAFKNPELTLFDVSKLLDTHPKKISQAINKGFDMNFNDFVNRYRTIEVIEILTSDQENLKTLLGVALDAGFNSKSTFNRAFKKHTNLAPKEYFQKIETK